MSDTPKTGDTAKTDTPRTERLVDMFLGVLPNTELVKMIFEHARQLERELARTYRIVAEEAAPQAFADGRIYGRMLCGCTVKERYSGHRLDCPTLEQEDAAPPPVPNGNAEPSERLRAAVSQGEEAAVRSRCIRCGADWNNGQLSISTGRIEQLRDIARVQNEWEMVTLCDLALAAKEK